MNTALKYIHILLISVFATSCINDETSPGGKPISIIEINGISEVYNTEKGDILSISPSVFQSISGKELTYTWEINQSVYSNDIILNYPCEELGSFNARLIVKNEDGSEFFPFIINVNSPYEEGILIISNGEQGESMISFMRKNPDTGELDYFIEEDCFNLNNPEVHFSSFVSDVTQSNGAVILACKGDDTSHNPSMIYYINDKTFDLENMVNTSEYPDFKPLRMHVCSKGIGGAAYPILTENGDIYEFASTEGTIIKSVSKLPYKYHSSSAFFDSGSGYQFNIIFWDKEKDIPVQIMTGYGPYYCVSDYSVAKYRDKITSHINIFTGHNPVKMFLPKLTKAQMLTQLPDLYIITVNRNTGMMHRTILPVDFWTTNNNDYSISLIITESLKVIGPSEIAILKEDSPMAVSGVFKAAYIGFNNKIYQWYYSSSIPLLNNKPFATIGNENTVITSLELSDDQKQIYAAVYDKTLTGKNGSFYIIDTESGNILKEYKNISYKPIKVIYKK